MGFLPGVSLILSLAMICSWMYLRRSCCTIFAPKRRWVQFVQLAGVAPAGMNRPGRGNDAPSERSTQTTKTSARIERRVKEEGGAGGGGGGIVAVMAPWLTAALDTLSLSLTLSLLPSFLPVSRSLSLTLTRARSRSSCRSRRRNQSEWARVSQRNSYHQPNIKAAEPALR